MVCYQCGCQLSEQDFCTACGADVTLYKKILAMSNHYYNEGLEKATVRDLSGAIDSLQQSLKFNSRNVEARNLLGLVYYEIGECTAAMSEWILSMNVEPKKNVASDYIEKIQNSPSRYDNIRQTMRKFNQALEYCRQDSKDLAMIQLKKVLSLSPRFVKAHLLLALLYIDNEEWEKAKREVNKALNVDRGNTQALRYLKEVEHMLSPEDMDRAVKRRREDTVRYQNDNEVIIQPASLAEGTRGGVSTLLNIVIGLILGAAAMYFFAVPAAKQQANQEAKASVTEIGNQLDVKSNQIQQLENTIASMEAAKEKLEAELDGYIGTEGTLKGYDQLLAATTTYLETKDIAQTAEKLDGVKQSIKVEEASADFQALYTSLLRIIGPSLSETYNDQGYVSLRNEDFPSAIESFSKAVYYDPGNADALLNLGNAYRRNEDMVNAIATFNQVMELFPDSDQARKAKQWLDDEG